MRDKPRSCRTIAEMEVGQRVVVDYSVTDEDLVHFAEISGDWNPLHFDEAYAASSMFGARIAHGMISLAKFSGIFGMDLPGLGTLWETQEVRFVAPVFLNRPYKAIAEVVSLDKRRATLATWVEDEAGHKVLEGRACVIPISEAARRRAQG
jgi:3-hydroxybutyryl-CoA dehydratase